VIIIMTIKGEGEGEEYESSSSSLFHLRCKEISLMLKNAIIYPEHSGPRTTDIIYR
jgi:hypothetical protein